MAWTDRVTEFPNRFRLEEIDALNKIYDLIRAEGEVSVEGTPLNAQNLTAETNELILRKLNTIHRVVGAGTTGNWRWIKYIDINGEQYYDAWLSYYGSLAVNIAMGGLYRSVEYAASSFIGAVGSTYIIYAFADCNNVNTWATISTHAQNDLKYVLISPQSHTSDHWVNVYVRGIWA